MIINKNFADFFQWDEKEVNTELFDPKMFLSMNFDLLSLGLNPRQRKEMESILFDKRNITISEGNLTRIQTPGQRLLISFKLAENITWGEFIKQKHLEKFVQNPSI